MIPKDKLIEMFGEFWYKVLEEYISSKAFTKLASTITALRHKKTIYPPRELIFRAFKETPYTKVKVILLAQNPYHNGSMDGLAFSNNLTDEISPALKILLQEIDNEYPEWKEEINYGRLDRQDLHRWAKQGVLLLNTALTIEKGNLGSHLELWAEFTAFVLKKLNEKNEIIWILLGKEAQKYTKFATNKTHSILTASHPAAEVYNKDAGFFGSNIFKEANTELELRNMNVIQW
jgi:uracil-DNA glycosylase